MIINYIGKKVKFQDRTFISAFTKTKKGTLNVRVSKDSGLTLKAGVNAFDVPKMNVFITDKDNEYQTIMITGGTECKPEERFVKELEEAREIELAEHFDF